MTFAIVESISVAESDIDEFARVLVREAAAAERRQRRRYLLPTAETTPWSGGPTATYGGDDDDTQYSIADDAAMLGKFRSRLPSAWDFALARRLNPALEVISQQLILSGK